MTNDERERKGYLRGYAEAVYCSAFHTPETTQAILGEMGQELIRLTLLQLEEDSNGKA